jgi:hypothetical protein
LVNDGLMQKKNTDDMAQENNRTTYQLFGLRRIRMRIR